MFSHAATATVNHGMNQAVRQKAFDPQINADARRYKTKRQACGATSFICVHLRITQRTKPENATQDEAQSIRQMFSFAPIRVYLRTTSSDTA